MIIYPALDLHEGKVVRLKGGDLAQQTVYSTDPVGMAQRWIAAGATWLHVVNLDGAFALPNGNEAVLKAIGALHVPVQFGGGLRTPDDIARAFDLGAARVVIGTLAVEHPELIASFIAQYGPDAIAIALDARNGKVTTRGWQHETALTPIELGKRMITDGVRHALYTDVNRDGGLTGVNVDSTVTLARETGLQVIASGGVTSLADITALHESQVVAGAILGTAIYEGLIDVADAIRLAGVS
jgi:phosphoribosylformimino-5-aminoimidazole carboxamide ribotide isomerase